MTGKDGMDESTMIGIDDGIVLLVEDDFLPAQAFVRALKIHGMDTFVVHAHDGIEALDYLFGRGDYAGRDTNVMPRLVVLDLNMPRMDGLDTLRRIRADERTRLLPVVMCSSSDRPQDIVDAYRLGANGYVDKFADMPFPEQVKVIADYWLVVNKPCPAAH
jgi:two-component system, response regulator